MGIKTFLEIDPERAGLRTFYKQVPISMDIGIESQNLERRLELKCSTFANSVTWYVLEISNNKSPYLDLP